MYIGGAGRDKGHRRKEKLNDVGAYLVSMVEESYWSRMCLLRLILNEAREGLFLNFKFSLLQVKGPWANYFDKFSISWVYM